MSQSSNSEWAEERKGEHKSWMCGGFFFPLFFFLTSWSLYLPSVSLDMKVMPVLWRSKRLPSGWNAIVCQTKGMVSQQPLVCMHDQHFQIRPLDLNLRFHSAQKAAGSFVSGEKLLGMSKPKSSRNVSKQEFWLWVLHGSSAAKSRGVLFTDVLKHVRLASVVCPLEVKH